MTFWNIEGLLAAIGAGSLTIGMVAFLIDWMKSVSAKLDRIITLLQEKRT